LKCCINNRALTNQQHALFPRALNTTTPKPPRASNQHHTSQWNIVAGFFCCFILFFYSINYLNLIMNLSEKIIKASDMPIIAYNHPSNSVTLCPEYIKTRPAHKQPPWNKKSTPGRDRKKQKPVLSVFIHPSMCAEVAQPFSHEYSVPATCRQCLPRRRLYVVFAPSAPSRNVRRQEGNLYAFFCGFCWLYVWACCCRCRVSHG
jgi:hypothetical protein